MDFGSDHYILETSIMVDHSRIREFTVIDWDLFRNIRSRMADAPDNLEEWCLASRTFTPYPSCPVWVRWQSTRSSTGLMTTWKETTFIHIN